MSDEKISGEISAERLKSFIERIERQEQEKASIAENIRDLYAEAKGTGYEPKIIRQIVKIRKQEAEKRREEEELLELYRAAVGLE